MLLWLHITRCAEVKLTYVEVVLHGITGNTDIQPCQKIQNGDVAPELPELDKAAEEADLHL